MKKIFLITVMLMIITAEIFPQVMVLRRSLYFYNYTPITDTAVNITYYSATIRGDTIKTKSNKLDLTATSRNIEGWLTYYSFGDSQYDSAQAMERNITGLEPEQIYGYYFSIKVIQKSGNIAWYKGQTKYFTTLASPNFLAGSYIMTEELKYWTNSNGKFLTVGE